MKPLKIRIESLERDGWLIQKIDDTVTPNKVVTKRYVTMSDVAGLFAKTTTFDTGFMDQRIVRYARSPKYDIWTLIAPATVRPVVYIDYDDDDHGMKKVAPAWMPASLWIIRAPQGSSKKWTANVALVDPLTKAVGDYPSPNVWNDDRGRICWGKILDTVAPMTFPRDCMKVVDTFFGSRFNDDLWDHEMPFSRVVESMGPKDIDKLTDAERMERLKTLLPDITLNRTIDKFYRSVVSVDDVSEDA
jgi:hypothetical protein